MRTHAIRKNATPLVWEFAGPTNVTGRVSDIEFNTLNPNIVYAGAATGGVFKSTNMGATWFPVFDEAAVLPIGDIGIDPINPDVLYVGTGEANGGHNNFEGGGVYKSTNGGVSWQLIGLEMTASIGRILVDPSNTQRVFVAALGSYFAPNIERGVYRSTDGGATWEKVLFISDTTGAVDLVMNPSNPQFLMAAMWERVRRPTTSHLYGATSGIYRSTDGGNNWHQLTNGLPEASLTNVGRIGLALSPSNPNIAYSLFNDGYEYLGIFKTTDSGNSWFNADPDGEASLGFDNFSWYFGQIRVHPTNPNDVWVLDQCMMHTTNAGETWGVYVPYHVDFHALAYHPTNPNIIMNGNDGGIDISADNGANWTEVAELPITQFYEIAIDYSNPQRLYGGTQDNSTPRTLTGALNDWDILYGGDGFYVIVHPQNSDIIYAESQYGNLVKSYNGGYEWYAATNGIDEADPKNWSTPVIMDPVNPDILYYGSNRVYRTTNGASNWSPISNDLTGGLPRLNTITTIAVAPSNTSVLYVGTADGRVWVTSNLGGSWTHVTNGLPFRWVTRVAVDPYDENTAYVTFSGLKWRDPQPHIFKTTNKGTSWSNISANLPDAPINGFVIDPNRPNVLFVGTDVGAYYTTNGGQSWQDVGPGLPLVSVYDLKIHDAGNFLVAGTHGRSMYKLDLSQITDIAESGTPAVKDFYLAQNFPNPFNPSTSIAYKIARDSRVQLKIYNILGQEVRTLVNEKQSAGKHAARWNGDDNAGKAAASGVYLYALSVDGKTQTKRMLLIK